jgi:hypothetical protein
MSENTEPPRNEAGQFASTPAEPLVGEEGVWADAGYVANPTGKAAPPEEYGSDDESLRELARQHDAKNGLYHEPVKRPIVFLETGEEVPENFAQTLEQAAHDDARVHRWEKDAWEAEQNKKVADDVDKARAEKIKGDKKLAEYYGVDADAPAKEADKASTTQAEASETDYVAPPDGELHPEVQKALQHPQVREALEQEFSRAETVRGEYTQALQTASDFARASFLEVAPELTGLAPEQFEQGLQMLAQVAPDRFNAAMNTLGRFHQIQTAQQQIAQQKAHAEQQAIETWAKSEDARLEKMGIKFTQETVNDVLEYAGEFGISRQQLGEALVAHPILRSAPIQKMMADAAKLHAMQKAPAKAIPKPVPTVLKPGVARSAAERSSDSLTALREKASASGSIEDAHRLYKAKQSRR